MIAILAIDQGTTGSTCLMVGADGAILGRGYREISQHYPQPGWVEHDAGEILARTVEAARDAIAQAGTQPTAIGLTNQRETIVVWDRRTGRPLAPALVWQDRRTASRCAELRSLAPQIETLTGLVVDPYFSATKLEWLLRELGLRPRAERGEVAAGTVDSWLLWCLTDGRVHATDPTNASRTMLFDIERREWSEDLCRLFGIPVSMLPEVRGSRGFFGSADPAFFGVSAPILGVAGDQQAALFGQGCWSAGEGKNTYGTGCFVLFNTGTQRPSSGKGLLTTLACDAQGNCCYALEASVFVAGAAVQWLRDGLGLLADAAESEKLAASLASNDGVYFVPALTGLGAPHWEPRARGTITGLTRGTTRAHLVRAALEAMAYSTADVLEAMAHAAGLRVSALRVDGGAASNDWLMQFQADVLGVPVERPELLEATALGAAALAGLSAGLWDDGESFLRLHQLTRFEPTLARPEARALRDGWRRAVKAALAWAQDEP
ncbi:MAG TPA: glycerol kinase GlpK [Gemmatimonadaceae bacterium]|nr:glycerol kinase GlpK [Gemmatimonadaceae bacterium]